MRLPADARGGFDNVNDAPFYARVRDYEKYWEIVYVFHYAYNA